MLLRSPLGATATLYRHACPTPKRIGDTDALRASVQSIRVLLAVGRRLGDFGEFRKNLRINEVRDHRVDLDVVLLRNLVEIR